MEIGTLYIVATPIGNLGDITLRALETLRMVDLIVCEDTRVTKNLLNHYTIIKPTMSYHQYSDDSRIREIQELLVAGKNIALVTDAGTPGISDPGNYLINQLINTKSSLDSAMKQIPIVPLPGASAVVAALSISGFTTDKFLFLGFPPHKKGRKDFFSKIEASEYTVVFYESCHRIAKCLHTLAEILDSDRSICVCRELSKKFESVYRGTCAEINQKKIPEKGEFVVVISSK